MRHNCMPYGRHIFCVSYYSRDLGDVVASWRTYHTYRVLAPTVCDVPSLPLLGLTCKYLGMYGSSNN